MNSNQGTRGNYQVSDFLYSGSFHRSTDSYYNIIVVSDNNKIHAALFDTLQHFSLNGKSINIFKAANLSEAKKIAELHPQIILVVIDETITVNGSYALFVDFVRNDLNNRRCFITFKENLVKSDVGPVVMEIPDENDPEAEFYYARDRLIDITRMVLITHDMENKITHSDIVPGETISGQPENVQETTRFTSDKMYNSIAQFLKEPVANIKVILDFLTNEPDLLDQKSSKELLYRMRESANNVHEMLEDFLFWSRLFKHDIYINPTKVDLAHIIRSNILLLKSTAVSKSISIIQDIDENISIRADEYMIITVFRNLLYNAVKWSIENTEIRVEAQRAGNHIVISIRESATENNSSAFQQYFEIENLSFHNSLNGEKGNGMGLMMCKDFIEKNNGSIDFINESEQQSEIRVSMPAWE
ncbi:MAG: HAMP domain-containing histidine kinase [Bacteroidales bacterium]|nr:HAMP domain-containing histidine kinase [Bacteroidales bacterium]